jgi:hypothetical protein
VADVKAYALPASVFFAVMARPKSPKRHDIASTVLPEADANALSVAAPPFCDRDRVALLAGHNCKPLFSCGLNLAFRIVPAVVAEHLGDKSLVDDRRRVGERALEFGRVFPCAMTG